MSPTSLGAEMKKLLALTIMVCAGCQLVDTVPQSSITPSAMIETKTRIEMFYRQHQLLPTTLNELPKRESFANRTTDAWHRPLQYVINSDDKFTLSSLGKDGIVGGDGDDADLVEQYQISDVYREQAR